MHRRYSVGQKQDNSSSTIGDLKQNMITHSGWYPHGIHLWTKNKNQSLKHSLICGWVIYKFSRATKDHEDILSSCVPMGTSDEGKILNKTPKQ